MDLFDLTQVALERAMSGASLRQRVLTNNLANANTPGFKRMDVDFHATLARELGGGSTRRSVEDTGFTVARDSATSERVDGNNTDVDGEMAALAENSLDYQAMVTISRARIRILESTINGR